MHMEALDRSFSTGSHQDGGLSLSSYPLTPEPQLNTLQYNNDCLQSEYATIQYENKFDNYQYGSNQSLLQESCSPISTSTPTPVDTPIHSFHNHTQRTPLSSMSSYSSDTSDPVMLSSSQSSGLSDMPSISNMSISSEVSSSSSSLFSADPATLCNPFSMNNNNNNSTNYSQKPRERKVASSQSRFSSSSDSSVPRRSSAPARDSSLTTNNANIFTSTNTDNPATRKDSFVYDVQLESDNVLLFVPDLDLVKSHLMFAVREEVDVLKERIGELMERINHLEYENTVLRKYATPDTLQQLQHHTPNP